MSEERREQESQQDDSLLETIRDALELPMFILAMIMLILLIVDFAFALSPEWRRIVVLSTAVIWWIFVAEYALRVFVAENRLRYIRTHLLDALFVLVPYLRVLRVFRAIHAVRLLRAVNPVVLGRTFVTTRRGLRQLARMLGRRSFAYVVATTTIMILVSALMMFFLERNAGGANILTYGDALWWSIGVVTTVGNEKFPVTAEGRVVAAILMIYGVGVFGYIAATLASYFINVDAGPEAHMTNEEAAGYRELSAKIDELKAHLKEQREKKEPRV